MPLGTDTDQERAVAHAFLVINTLIELIDACELNIFKITEEDLRYTCYRLRCARDSGSLAKANYALHLLAYMPPHGWDDQPKRREIAHLARGLMMHLSIYQLCCPRPRIA